MDEFRFFAQHQLEHSAHNAPSSGVLTTPSIIVVRRDYFTGKLLVMS